MPSAERSELGQGHPFQGERVDDDDDGNALLLFSSRVLKSHGRTRGVLQSGPSTSSSCPNVNVCVPPGGASTLDVGLPVTTLPQFWSRPDAKAFADAVLLLFYTEKKKNASMSKGDRNVRTLKTKDEKRDTQKFTHVASLAPTTTKWLRWLLCMTTTLSLRAILLALLGSSTKVRFLYRAFFSMTDFERGEEEEEDEDKRGDRQLTFSSSL